MRLRLFLGAEPQKAEPWKAERSGFISAAVASARDDMRCTGLQVLSRMEKFQRAKKRLDAAEVDIAVVDCNDGDALDAAVHELSEAQNDFEMAGGYSVDEVIGRVLSGLGFTEEDQSRSCSDFSGGWQMRIALARLLLSEPEILILDEPTNHLDAAARSWLAEYLKSYVGTVLTVTHDENLLRKAVTSVAEVRNRRLELYRSRSYDQWEIERVERVERQKAEYEKQQEEIDRLQDWVDKFGAKATKATQAESRKKMIAKLKREQVAPPEKISTHRPQLRLPKPPPCHTEMLVMKDVSFGWEEEPIVTGATLKIEKGHRVVVRGPNGAGKSTFMNALAGELEAKAGERREGEGLKLGFFKQDLAQELDQGAVAVNTVQAAGWEYDSLLTLTQARNTMGALGLSGEKATREIGMLSGGEKARVALACFALVPHNMLLLDEPSNHLDVETIQSLTEALRSFPGAVVVISHDRAFCEALDPTHVITVEDGALSWEQRGLREGDWKDDDLSAQAVKMLADIDSDKMTSALEAAVRPGAPEAAVAPAPPKPQTKEEREAARALQKKKNAAEKKMEKLEKEMETFEEKQEELEASMMANGNDSAKLGELQIEMDNIEAKLEEILENMDELEQLLAS
ncbi:hypothetical protein CYMTET_50093 [Cymbomonas tetramitiformis]|uniref:ABC transporter domain-containing protein n=1 Tax=Cymbomonas tetramitiformis TaxID=36881 RepID=A0AAE0BQ62_9CHLO|nr:hypothetical protein CYMTET_50093 [Cymbomonas tetramitiformis]